MSPDYVITPASDLDELTLPRNLREEIASALSDNPKARLELYEHLDSYGRVWTLVVDEHRAVQTTNAELLSGDWDKATQTFVLDSDREVSVHLSGGTLKSTTLDGYRVELLGGKTGWFAVRATHRDEADTEPLENFPFGQLDEWLEESGLYHRDTTWEAHGDVSQAEVAYLPVEA